MTLYIIFYFTGNEHDFEHLVADTPNNAKKLFLEYCKEDDIHIESVDGVYPVLSSWGENNATYEINLIKLNQ